MFCLKYHFFNDFVFSILKLINFQLCVISAGVCHQYVFSYLAHQNEMWPHLVKYYVCNKLFLVIHLCKSKCRADLTLWRSTVHSVWVHLFGLTRKIYICMGSSTGAFLLLVVTFTSWWIRQVKSLMNYWLFQRYGMHLTRDTSLVNSGPEHAECCSVSPQTWQVLGNI